MIKIPPAALEAELAQASAKLVEQAAEIERLRAELQNHGQDEKLSEEIERLRAALREIKHRKDYQLPSAQDIARAALEERT